MQYMRSKLMVALTATLAITAPGARGQMGSPAQFVLTDKLAYLPLPPEMIAGPVVQAVYYSPDGHYALVQRDHTRITQAIVDRMFEMKQPPEGEVSLILWDSEDRSSTVVWRGKTPETFVRQVEWLHGSDAAIVLIHISDIPDPANPQAPKHAHDEAIRISGASGRAVEIAATEPGSPASFSVSASPLLPLAVIEDLHPIAAPAPAPVPGARQAIQGPQQTYETLMYLVDSHSRTPTPIAFHTDDVFPSAQWDVQGNPLIMEFHRGPGQVKPIQLWFTINARNGATAQLSTAPQVYGEHPQTVAARDIVALTTQVVAKEGDVTRQVGMLWLESSTKSEQPRILISGDTMEGKLLPGRDIVLYRSQQAFWAVPLLRLDRDKALLAMNAAKRTEVMQKAKQLGLALIMYANDNDDTLPAPGDLSGILPYLGNSNGMLDGFNYTYAGGSLADIQSPAQTVLGTVDGPGGHAIVYSDGHVKWQ